MADDFKNLIGAVKKVENKTSDEFYQNKSPNLRRKQEAEDFIHAPISQSGFEFGAEDFLEFKRAGVQNTVLKKLARGEIRPDESIDLHGMSTVEAEIYTYDSIESLKARYMTCLRIVHGKGYHAGDSPHNKPMPKLKNFIARYLSEHPRVLAYVSCPNNRGGTGAVYVLLSAQNLP